MVLTKLNVYERTSKCDLLHINLRVWLYFKRKFNWKEKCIEFVQGGVWIIIMFIIRNMGRLTKYLTIFNKFSDKKWNVNE